jgi:hypothetical protein
MVPSINTPSPLYVQMVSGSARVLIDVEPHSEKKCRFVKCSWYAGPAISEEAVSTGVLQTCTLGALNHYVICPLKFVVPMRALVEGQILYL